MTKYPDELRILEALRTIKTVCELHQSIVGPDGCIECPFSFSGGCPFIEGDAPKDWKLNSCSNVWKAFRDAR